MGASGKKWVEEGPDSNSIPTRFEASPDVKSKVGVTLNPVEGESERKWLLHIRKIYNAIHNMDKQKYLEPKFSTSLYPVIKFLQKKFGPGSTITNISKFSQS